MDIIVTNKKIKHQGEFMTLDVFLKKAEEGLDLNGDLYIDVEGLDEDTYNSIKNALNETIFFSTNDDVPSFVTNCKKMELEVDPFDNKVDNEEADSEEDSFDDARVLNLMEELVTPEAEKGNKEARLLLFGSSKGGTGKTFTCLISAYRYAKTHPNEKVAVADFDIIDGQVGISIHKINPTMLNFYKQYLLKETSFDVMEGFKVKSQNFPPNVDFYLSPKDNPIQDEEFWDVVFYNLISNYDVVFFDSGIDYLNYPTISKLYKIADKIILISTTSIKSVSSVQKQIGKLKGEIPNKVFKAEDEIGDRLHLVITQAFQGDLMNKTVFETFKDKIDIICVFGCFTGDIQKAEYLGEWNIFDKNRKFCQMLDKIIS